jgi:hypothetical protein
MEVGQMATAPELEAHSGSWVVTVADGRCFETFSRKYADQCAAAGRKVETIAQYLGRVNREVQS